MSAAAETKAPPAGTVTLAREGAADNYLSREGARPRATMSPTSGKGGIYPRGLLIGTIQSLTPDSDGLTMTGGNSPLRRYQKPVRCFRADGF